MAFSLSTTASNRCLFEVASNFVQFGSWYMFFEWVGHSFTESAWFETWQEEDLHASYNRHVRMLGFRFIIGREKIQ